MKSKIAALALSLVAGAAHAQVTFTPLGLPEGEEPQDPKFTDAYGVSNDGVVVGAMNVPNVGFRAFRWTATSGLLQIDGITTDAQIYARSITPDGVTTVGENTDPRVGYFQTAGGLPVSMGIPDETLYDQTAANDVADDGLRAAGLISVIEDGTFRMGRWTEGSGWENLGVLPGDFESVGNTISADGTIVAGYSIGFYFTAVKWTEAGGLEILPYPFVFETDSSAIAMSADGSVIVGQARDLSDFTQAVVWRGDGSTQVLDMAPGYDTASAYGVSGDGSIIGGTFAINAFGDDTAAFWTADGTDYVLHDYLSRNGIDVFEWRLLAVTEVSQNGKYLVGRGINPDGLMEAFLVELPFKLCAADMDGDKDADLDDFFAFLSAFDAQDAQADVNGSGLADLDDLFVFLGSFDIGC